MGRDEDDEPAYEAILMTSGRVNLSEMEKNSFKDVLNNSDS